EGGIEDWRRQRARMLAAQTAAAAPVRAAVAAPAMPAASSAVAAPAAKARKLSYKEKREFDELPARIAALEAEQKAITEQLADNDLYAKSPAQVPLLQARFAQIDDGLLAAMERWEALSAPA
ncbi:MAG: ABC transporter ATP-binding protein, partial [Microbacteriaceae bacterium]|nr:ABC transporter ATP-binding protein [Burkholderiaceae bacterium]